MCCFKVFRLVRDFIRHATQHADAAERKSAYLRNTCDELRALSDKQLELAIKQDSSAAEGKKRTWLEAFGLQTATNPTGFNMPDIAPIDQPRRESIASNKSIRHLDDATIEASAPLSPLTVPSPAGQQQAVGMAESMISRSLDDSNQIQLPGMEGQGEGWDILEDWDPPVVQIMNSIPTWIATWEPESRGTVNLDA